MANANTTPATESTSALAQAWPTFLNWDARVPVVDRAATFHVVSGHGGIEIGSFMVHLLPSGKVASLKDASVCFVNGSACTIKAPCIVEFQDDRPAGLVIGFKTFDGNDQVYAWMFPDGCGTLDDSKLVHVRLTDLLCVTGEPKNSESGDKLWLTILNSYLGGSSDMFKQLNITKYETIKQQWTANNDAPVIMSRFDAVFNASELIMRKEAKQFATKNGKVVTNVETAFINEHMPAIEKVREAYEEMVDLFAQPIADRFIQINCAAEDTGKDIMTKVIQSVR